MQHEYEAPEVDKDAFHCPSCGAYAHQTWYRTRVLPLHDVTTDPLPKDQADNPTLQALSNLTPMLSTTTVVSSQPLVSHCERCAELALEPRVQPALDYVRVIGNSAVHPGSIDLKDDTPTVATLFTLVNLIAEQTVSRPKRMQAMYDTLPAPERMKIDKRDGNPTRD